MGVIRLVGADAGFAFLLTGGWLVLGQSDPAGRAMGAITFLLGIVLVAAAFR